MIGGIKVLTTKQMDNINELLGFSLTELQFNSIEESKAYFFRNKTEYKIQALFKVSAKNIMMLIKSKKFMVKELDIKYGLHDILIIFEAPTPALYHIDRSLYRWKWSIYDLNLKICLYETNNIQSPDITSKLFA